MHADGSLKMDGGSGSTHKSKGHCNKVAGHGSRTSVIQGLLKCLVKKEESGLRYLLEPPYEHLVYLLQYRVN